MGSHWAGAGLGPGGHPRVSPRVTPGALGPRDKRLQTNTLETPRSPCSPRPPPGEVGSETQRTKTKRRDRLGRPAEQTQQGDGLRLLSRPLPLAKPQTGPSPWPGGHGPRLPGPQSHSDVPVRPSLQNKPLPPPLSPSHNLHTHLSVQQQRPGPSPTTKVDRWMHGWTE